MSELDNGTLLEFIEEIHRQAGIRMDQGRKDLIQNRLRPRIRKLGLPSFPAYLQHLRSAAGESQVFIDLLTTNETYFYRTPRIWDYLRGKFLPEWIKLHPDTPFRAWSAAASSGEEASTLGILLQEARERHPRFQYQILGTDISTEILGYADEGIYSGRSIEAFKTGQSALFSKFMTAQGDGYRVTDEIRSRIRFRRHNLFEKLTREDLFDLVLIRNVLIYFAATDQEKVLQQVRAAMKPQGTLVIGESESLSQIKTAFEFRQPLIYGAAS